MTSSFNHAIIQSIRLVHLFLHCLTHSSNTMAVIENWLPPSRENWELVSYLWQFFPLVSRVARVSGSHSTNSYLSRSQQYNGSLTGIPRARLQQKHDGMYLERWGGLQRSRRARSLCCTYSSHFQRSKVLVSYHGAIGQWLAAL